MPVALFTIHAYRSWEPDHPRGYVRRNEGILPPDPEMAGRYDRHARHARVRFDSEMQRIIIDGCMDICARRNWRLHHVVVVASHFHPLVSWRDQAIRWMFVRDTIKRLIGMMLAQQSKQRVRKWMSRRGPPKPVHTRDHFELLMTEYLPNHARGRRRGSGWCERRGYYGASFDQTLKVFPQPRVATRGDAHPSRVAIFEAMSNERLRT